MHDESRCPVCGRDLTNELGSHESKYRQKNYLLCSKDCQAKFEQAPEKYVDEEESRETSP
jgi:YHS domain-containing protein